MRLFVLKINLSCLTDGNSVLIGLIAWDGLGGQPLFKQEMTQFPETNHQGPLLLTWINLNLSMDK